MTCASCAGRIERGLNELEGVHASVNYATERARRNRGAGSGSGQGQDVAAGDRGATAGVRTVSDGQLPFTGLELISLALTGLALTGAGWALLRRLRLRAAAGDAE